MTRLHKLFTVLLGLGVLAAGRLMFEPEASHAGSAPVIVMNTPLPVSSHSRLSPAMLFASLAGNSMLPTTSSECSLHVSPGGRVGGNRCLTKLTKAASY
jgi:hypothetical protein